MFILAVITAASLMPLTASAHYSIGINSTNFPDSVFRNFVADQLDLNNDGYLSENEISAAKTIDVEDRGITSLKGIEYFTSLDSLYCGSNKLTGLDVSSNTKLTLLDCSQNSLTSLNVSQNKLLNYLWCSKNALSSLNVSGCAQLKDLRCSQNKLTALNVTNNPALTVLFCVQNSLTSLDLSGNTQLEYLDVKVNNLTSLDITGLTKLKSAGLDPIIMAPIPLNSLITNTALRNYLKSSYDINSDGYLSAEEVKSVTEINVSNNQMTSLSEITYFPMLKDLYCINCGLGSLNVSNNPKLERLRCSGNALTSLSLISSTELYSLYCDNNKLTSLDLHNNTKLKELVCDSNKLTWLDVSTCYLLDPDEIIADSGVQISQSKVCPSHKYTDAPVKGSWAHEGIDYCIAHGLMNGMSDTSFAPAGTVTRAQLVTILYRAANGPYVTFKGAFTDVPSNQWYSSAIEWAAANGIVNGISPGKFDPMGNITREQIAAILYRYNGSPAVSGSLSKFPDSWKVSSYAEKALIWATKNGLINGIATGETTVLAPQDNATREQIAAIIMRFRSGSYKC